MIVTQLAGIVRFNSTHDLRIVSPHGFKNTPGTAEGRADGAKQILQAENW